MTTAYSTNLGLALPVQGELSGTWGDTVNKGITDYVDIAVAGTQTISGSQTAVTLSLTNGNASATNISQVGSGATGTAQYAIINCTGNPAGLLTITAPASSRQYVVINATSTNQSVKIVGVGPTTGVTLVAGEKAQVAWNGTDYVKVASTVITNLTGTLPVVNGGTGLSSGTSGGIPYFSASNTIASSAALAANQIVLGGGAGVAPATTTTGTGVVTAINNNANSANGLAVLNASAALPVANGGLALTSIAARSIPVANVANTYTTVTPGAGQSIRINAGNTAWEAYTPSSGAGDAVLANNNAFTGANTFYNATGQTFAPATANDGIIVRGRSGGTSTYRVTLTTDTLSANRTVTFPDGGGNYTVGYRNLPPVGTQTGSYTLSVADVGKYVQVGSGGSITIPTSTFAEGDAITLYNNTAGNITITCSALTTYVAGTDSIKTSLTLATRGVATILFYSATACVVSGSVT